MGVQRQEHYLKTFQSMQPNAQQALKDIYHQAHKGGREMGQHVVMAMVASVRYPDLLRFTLSNIVIRVMLKRFQLDGNHQQALQMTEVLDDFHVALDEFVRSDVVKIPQLALLNGERRQIVHELRLFKKRTGTSVDRAKRVKSQ